MPIFSVSGLRGVVPSDLTPVGLAQMGRAFGAHVQGGSCILARDTRTTGSLASRAVASGLMYSGCRIIDLGVQPTPVLFKEVAVRGADGGVVVTSSHNPPEWNGLKFVMKGGRGLFEEEVGALRVLGSALVRIGSYSVDEPTYVESLMRHLGHPRLKRVRLAVDPNGGTACNIVSQVLRSIGCEVHVVNGSQGVFQRLIDPTEDPLILLRETVVKSGCDAGFAYDCDGDRLVIMGDGGEKLPPDHVFLLILRSLLDKESRRVAVSVDTTQLVERLVSDAGGMVLRTKVGEANVVRAMLAENCSVGGEGSSGGLIDGSFNLCRDGVLASALVAGLVARHGSLREALGDLPAMSQIRRKTACPRSKASAVVERIAEGTGRTERTDGVKIWVARDSWVLIRPSNTEDVVRVSVEAPSRGSAEELAEKYLARIRRLAEE
ncbi:MAG: phosphomannomutase [Thaumarchaeota archaeon]|nr:phosphomannomutase [Nitrososphaerota archaeon]